MDGNILLKYTEFFNDIDLTQQHFKKFQDVIDEFEASAKRVQQQKGAAVNEYVVQSAMFKKKFEEFETQLNQFKREMIKTNQDFIRLENASVKSASELMG